tara:strand:- start:715 stop:921 length:207 start_codon:yes stop_codon:yes gene_type:complete
MLDSITIMKCRSSREILNIKIKNLEHGIAESEKIISESNLNPKYLTFLRKKVADSIQDLELLYQIKDN